jgi:hypothetical protein
VYVQFEDDSSMVEVLRGQVVPAAGCASACHSVGDDGASVRRPISVSSPVWLELGGTSEYQGQENESIHVCRCGMEMCVCVIV